MQISPLKETPRSWRAFGSPFRGRMLLSLALLPALAFLALAGCSGHSINRRAQLAEATGDWDQAVIHYLEALRIHPENIAYRAALMRAKIQAAQAHFEKGKQFRAAGVLERAMVEYRKAVELDPTNQYAESELRKVVEEIHAAREGRRPRTIAEMKDGVKGRQAQPPVLNPRSDEPIFLFYCDGVLRDLHSRPTRHASDINPCVYVQDLRT